MQAVITAGGHQFIVSPDQIIEIDLVDEAVKKLEFEALLVIDGDKISVGTPTVAGMTVTAEVIAEVKGEKLKVLKFKAKKRVHKQTGHRQHYTQIKVIAIGSAKAAPAAKKATAKPQPAAA
jgi:large subunit ribosomal protein L21